MSKKIIKYIMIAVVLLTISAPVVSYAVDYLPLVTCGTEKDSVGKVSNPCTFNDVILLIDRLIKFILFVLAIPVAAIMFCYAGILMVTSGGNSGQFGKGKGIFINVAYGLLLAAGGWLIVTTLLTLLGYTGVTYF